MQIRTTMLIVSTLTLAWASVASANLGLDGHVYCDVNGNGETDVGVDTTLDGVVVEVTGDLGFSSTAVSGQDFAGYYNMRLSTDVPQNYLASVDESTIPGSGVVLQPPTNQYAFTGLAIGDRFTRDFLVSQEACADTPVGACWLTAGGVKFSQITGTDLAERGPRHNLGGNVFPSCSSEPGNGGQWNHLDHGNKLHFQGFDILTVECGNVPGIEEGSESPVTDFNYIEFEGDGRLLGIKGNKLDIEPVFFFARAEDRNEPGNESATAGAEIDRYFLHVFSDPGNPSGTTLLLVDEDGDPSTVDPVTITGGNLQLHQSSCDE